jgi:hypothetical protein
VVSQSPSIPGLLALKAAPDSSPGSWKVVLASTPSITADQRTFGPEP